MKRSLALTILAGLQTGCVATMLDAPYTATISVPEDFSINWSAAANKYDLGGQLLFFDVGMYDTNSEMPLESIRVEITSNYPGVYLLPQESVELVAYPGLPAGIQSYEDVKAACTDDAGNYILTEDWCAWYWDTESQQFYQFSGTYANSYAEDSGSYYWYAPTSMVGQTNSLGLLRVYAMIDVMPELEDGTGFAPVQVIAQSGWATGSFMIDPAAD